MNCLEPLTTHSPSTSSARVLVAPASEPAPGSVRPNPASARPATRSGSQRLLLLVGPEGQDRVDAQPDGGLEGDADRLVDPADLLDGDAEAGEVAVLAGAAVLLGRGEPEQPEVAHLRAPGRPGSGASCPTPRRAARSRLSAKSRTLRRNASCSADSSKVIAPPWSYAYVNVRQVLRTEAQGRGEWTRRPDGPGRSADARAEEYDVTLRTLRHYEELGLLFPERLGTARVYHQRDRIRLELILRGKRLGFSLAEIATIVNMYDDQPGEAGQLEYLLDQFDGPPRRARPAPPRHRRDPGELDEVEARCRDDLSRLAPGTPGDAGKGYP